MRPSQRRTRAERGRNPTNRILGLLGIARRAGRIAIGTHAVTAAARSGQLEVLVVAGDASVNAVSRLGPEAREVARVTVATRAVLGRALGRGGVAVAGVTDAALAKRVLEEERALQRRDENSGTREDPGRQVP